MTVALRRLAIVVIAVLFVLIAAIFAYGNPEPIDLDVGWTRFEDVSLAVVLALTFVAGAVFGGIFSAWATVRHLRERRALRKELRRTETELETLRSPQQSDAD